MADFLHLPHLRTLQVQDCGDHYELEAEGGIAPSACPPAGEGPRNAKHLANKRLKR